MVCVPGGRPESGTMQLLGIDYLIVLFYLGGIVLLGFVFKSTVHSSNDFFLAGKTLPFWAIGMSIVVSDIGAVDMVGLTGQAYRFGIVAANFDWIGSVPAMILAGLVFVPYYWRAGVYTIPEYLGRRYNVHLQTLAAIAWLVFMTFGLGVVLWATGVLLAELMGWNIMLAIVVTAVVVGFYTIMGGLTAVVMTDVVQMIIMFIGSLAILILGLWEVGGWGALVEKVEAMGPAYANHFNLVIPATEDTPYPWTGILFGLGLVLAPAYFIGNQTIVQRCLGAADAWSAKASMLFAAFLKICIPVLVVVPGLVAVVLYPRLEDGDSAYAVMIRELLPPGMTGLVFAAFFAALMSSVDSALNSAATIFTKDVYEKFIRKGAGDRHYLFVGRLVTFVVLIAAVVTAPLSERFEGVYVYVQTINSFIQGPFLAVLILGIFWKRTTQWAGLIGFLSGIAIAAILHVFKGGLFTIQEPFLYIAWWSFAGSLLITAGVSFVTRPHPPERLRGLVYGMVGEDEELQEALRRRIK